MPDQTVAQTAMARRFGRRIEMLDDQIAAALKDDPHADVSELQTKKAELEAQIENATDDDVNPSAAQPSYATDHDVVPDEDVG